MNWKQIKINRRLLRLVILTEFFERLRALSILIRDHPFQCSTEIFYSFN